MTDQSLADLLDDLTPEELTNLITELWISNSPVTRAAIKAFRKKHGKPGAVVKAAMKAAAMEAFSNVVIKPVFLCEQCHQPIPHHKMDCSYR